jgi:invasion protein IalB
MSLAFLSARRMSFLEARRPWVSSAVLGLLLVFLAHGVAQAQSPLTPEGGTVKAQHGDWQHFCKAPPPGAKHEVCALVQSVTAEDNDNIGLTAIVQKFSDGNLTLRIVTSLGVFLEKGLGVRVDNEDLGHVPFVRCLPMGCQAQLILDAKLTAKMRSGKTMLLVIYKTQEAGIGIPISLSGFGPALAGLN